MTHGGRESTEIEELGQHHADSREGEGGVHVSGGGGGWEEAGKRHFFSLTKFSGVKLYVRPLDNTALIRADDMAKGNW